MKKHIILSLLALSTAIQSGQLAKSTTIRKPADRTLRRSDFLDVFPYEKIDDMQFGNDQPLIISVPSTTLHFSLTGSSEDTIDVKLNCYSSRTRKELTAPKPTKKVNSNKARIELKYDFTGFEERTKCILRVRTNEREEVVTFYIVPIKK